VGAGGASHDPRTVDVVVVVVVFAAVVVVTVVVVRQRPGLEGPDVALSGGAGDPALVDTVDRPSSRNS
jgi:hypothetical protein